MEKGLIKGLCRIIWEQVINPKETGYEMGCLISSEFTPAPDFSDLATKATAICNKYKVTYEEFRKAVWTYASDDHRGDSIYTQMMGYIYLSEQTPEPQGRTKRYW